MSTFVLGPSGTPLVVAAALVDDLDEPRRLLAARRSAPKSLAGMWEFPGGKVEIGESPEQGLRRELLEELGVKARLGPELPGPDGELWPIVNGHHMRVWTATITWGRPAPLLDHDALTWLEPGAWTELDWLVADVPIVKAVQDWANSRVSGVR